MPNPIIPSRDELLTYEVLPSGVIVKTLKDVTAFSIDGVLLPVDVSAILGNFLTVAAATGGPPRKWQLPAYLRARWVKKRGRAVDNVPTTVNWSVFGPTVTFEPSERALQQAQTGSTRVQDLLAATLVSNDAPQAQQEAFRELAPMVDGLESSEMLEPTRLRIADLFGLCGVESRFVETPFSVQPTEYWGPVSRITLFDDRTLKVAPAASTWNALRDLCAAMVLSAIPNREMRDVTSVMPSVGATSLLLRDFWARFLRLNRMSLMMSVIRLQPQVLHYHLMKPFFPIIEDYLTRENRGDALALVQAARQGLDRLPLLPPFTQLLASARVTMANTRYGSLPVLPWFGQSKQVSEIIANAKAQGNVTWAEKGMRLFDSAGLLYDWMTDIATSLTSGFNDYGSMIEAKLNGAQAAVGSGDAPPPVTADFPLNTLELGVLLNTRFSETTALRSLQDTNTLGLLGRFAAGSGAALTVELRGLDVAHFDGHNVSGNAEAVLVGLQPTAPYGNGLMARAADEFETETVDTVPAWYVAGVSALTTRPESFVFEAEGAGASDAVARFSPYFLHPSERIGEPELYLKGAEVMSFLSSRDALTKAEIARQLNVRYLGRADSTRPRYTPTSRRLAASAALRAAGKALDDGRAGDWLPRSLTVWSAANFATATSTLERSAAVEVDPSDSGAAVPADSPFGDDLLLWRASDAPPFLRRVSLRFALTGQFFYLRSGRRRLDLATRSVVTTRLVGQSVAQPTTPLGPVSLTFVTPLLDRVVTVTDERPPEFFISPDRVRQMSAPRFQTSDAPQGAAEIGALTVASTPPPAAGTSAAQSAPGDASGGVVDAGGGAAAAAVDVAAAADDAASGT